DKFVGDEIMVLFGAPQGYGRDAERACRCARAMILARQRLNEEKGESLAIGVGLATGRVVAGCMGSEDRLNYTVLGERVNLAARLCSSAKPMEALICPATRDRLGKACGEIIPRPDLKLKGYSGNFTAFTLADGPSDPIAIPYTRPPL